MKRLPLFFFLTALIIPLNSCGPKCEEYLVQDSLKEYALFNVGTWWIIQNDSTLEKDTVNVNAQDHGYFDSCELENTTPARIEYFTVRVEYDSGLIFRPAYGLTNVAYVCSEPCTYFCYWNWLDLTGNTVPIANSFDTLTVNGKIYHDVKEVRTGPLFAHFYAKGFFCIKAVDYSTGESYSLVDSHILQ